MVRGWKSIVGTPLRDGWSKRQRHPMCSLLAATYSINFKTHYAEDLARAVPPELAATYRAGTKGKRYYEWARVELSCRQPEGFSRWFYRR